MSGFGPFELLVVATLFIFGILAVIALLWIIWKKK